MNRITIGFSKPKNRFFPIFSWIIRLYEKTPYSHVFIRLHMEEINREVVFEAVGPHVRMVTVSEWQSKAEEVASFSLDISHSNYISILQYCIDHQAEGYGIMQNVGVIIADLFNLKHNLFTTGMNCSEFIYNILKCQGYHLEKNKNLITPKDIFNLLNKTL